MKEFAISDLSINTINVIDAAIENPNGLSIDAHTATSIQFGIGIRKFISIQENGIQVRLNVDIKCFDDNKDEFTSVKANFTIQFFFNIENLGDYVELKEDDKVNVAPNLTISILNIVYSTSRGIIYTRCLGTIMGEVILPVIDSQTLLEISNAPVDKNAEEGK
jgi:hypothetical protein